MRGAGFEAVVIAGLRADAVEVLPDAGAAGAAVAVALWYGKSKKEDIQDRGPNAPRVFVTEVNLYPIKSCKGISLTSATINEYGFENDRRWMVVLEETGRFITQRQQPKLAVVTPSFRNVSGKGKCMVLEAPDLPRLNIPLEPAPAEEREVSVWATTCMALDEGEDVANWFSAYLGVRARLVRLKGDHTRPVPEKYSVSEKPKANVSFADAFPFLLISEESLADLNAHLAADGKPPVPMNRFRPNIVVKGMVAPFAEDNMPNLKIGNVEFRAPKKCTRCKLTTVDQDRGEFSGPEPLDVLHSYREVMPDDKNAVCFGMNLIHLNNGVISVGDDLVATL